MPNKGKNKEKLGHLFIDKMNSETKCIPFINSKEPLACNCCSKINVPFHMVQLFFHDLIQTYWSTERNYKFVAPGQLTTVEGYHLAHFLEDYCTKLSLHKPMYEFEINISAGMTTTITLCLPTTVCIFGLPTQTFHVVKKTQVILKK